MFFVSQKDNNKQQHPKDVIPSDAVEFEGLIEKYLEIDFKTCLPTPVVLANDLAHVSTFNLSD
jgi:hypothetical protein